MISFIDRCILGIATLGPIGYLPAGGTWASLVTLGTLWLLNDYSPILCLYLVGLALCISVVIIERALTFFDQEDPEQIVLDEFMGMSAAFALCSKEPFCLLITFLFFRVLDIVKPSVVGRMELCPGVLGVVGDDLVAGFLAATLSNVVCTALYTISSI